MGKSQDQINKERMMTAAVWLMVIAATVAFMSAVYIATTNVEKNNIKNQVSSSISIMKDVCQKYDDYNLSASAKDMQSIINKINVLTQYTDDIDLDSEEELMEYAKLQYLTGIFVLDAQLDLVSSADIENRGRTYLLQRITAEGEIQSVIENPKKVYAGNITVDSVGYDYAVKARSDAPGVIICYAENTQTDGDKYEFSLSTLLPGGIFGNGAVFVITDGSKVICTNEKSLENIRPADAPVTSVIESDRMKGDSSLINLELNGKQWYGMHDTCRDYLLYIFYPESIVFADRAKVMAAVFGGYALCCALILMAVQRSRRKKLMQMEKEYHLMNAISSIYSTNLLIWLKENRYSIIIKNENMEKVLEGIKKADEAREALIENFVAEPYREDFRKFTDLETIAERLRGKRFIGYSYEGVDGKWNQALLIPQSRDPDDEVTSVMLVTRDVSDQKKREMEYQEKLRQTAERANRANAAKTDFLRRMNHDIRTPINGIVGMIEINSKSDDLSVIKENREKARTAAYHLLGLVNDVLEMSKLEDGTAPLERECFNIQKLTSDIMIVAGMRSAEHKITLKNENSSEDFTYPYVYGSPVRVRQILLNIISNAIKYNKPGGSITFNVSMKKSETESNTVICTYVISDTGVGMKPEYLEHIFEPFSQEKSDARTVYRGTGLGMSIVKTLIDQMNGTVNVESELNEGTTVTVAIPFDIADRSDIADENAEHASGAVASCGLDGIDTIDPAEMAGHKSDAANINAYDDPQDIAGMNIIIAEDNELNMEIARYILEDAGAKVHPSYDGAQAVDAFSSAPPGTYDAILMDIMMPVMDGYEATRSIRGMGDVRPDAADIPVIAMTANAFADDRQKSMEAGMNEHITKPIDIEKMISVISEYGRKNRHS